MTRAQPLFSGARRVEHHVVNPVVSWLLQTPAHWLLSRWLTVLTYEGRRSGRTFTIPVLYRRVDETIVLLTLAAKTNWWKNFRGGHPLTLLVRGTKRKGTGTVETDEAVVLETLRWVASPMRRVSALLLECPIPGEDRLEETAEEFVVVIVTSDDERTAYSTEEM